MVRNYKKKAFSQRDGNLQKPYMNYTREDLNNAVRDVKSKKLTMRAAAERYGVPKSTIERHLNGKNIYDTPGHPNLFTETEEKIFVNYLILLGEWGHPFDQMDLRVFAQRYLNSIGRTLYNLPNNLPGKDWAANFMDRHREEVRSRISSNISTDRAKVDQDTIDKFFDHCEKSLENVDPDCIINYDETNLTDDPGSAKYIFKRGTRYPEKVANSSKTAISLMFAGAADGTLLPPYVVYKSEHLYDTWLLGGPDHVRYNKSRSGWFDFVCFEDWFITIVIPFVRTKEGRKVVLIGDNLSSHFSEKVLELCGQYRISFVCLPPKSTHIMQPLDVAFYAPLKHYWREVLTEWKKNEGRKLKTLAKNSFPRLLGKLLQKLKDKSADSENLKAGFDKCGLYPLNRNRPKSRLPGTSAEAPVATDIHNNASTIVVDMLRELRAPTSQEPPRRKKRCNVSPGKSITVADLQPTGTKKAAKNKSTAAKSKMQTKVVSKNSITQNESETSNSDIEMSVHSDSDVMGVEWLEMDEDYSYDPDLTQYISPKNTSIDNQMPAENHTNNIQNERNNRDIMDAEKERLKLNNRKCKEKGESEISKKKTENNQNYISALLDKDHDYQIVSPENPSIENQTPAENRTNHILNKENNNDIMNVENQRNSNQKCTANDKMKTKINKKKTDNVLFDKNHVEDQMSAGRNESQSTHLDITQDQKDITDIKTRQSSKRKEKGIKKQKNTVKKKMKKTDSLKIEKSQKLKEKNQKKMEKGNFNFYVSGLPDDEDTMVCDSFVTAPTSATTLLLANKENNDGVLSGCYKENLAGGSNESDSIEGYSKKNVGDTVAGCSKEKYLDDVVAGCSKEKYLDDAVAGCSKEDVEVVPDDYDVNDYVLVRYISKKKVEYFVGIVLKKKKDAVTISFYKTIGRSDSTRFIKPKKPEIDTVNDKMVVKTVKLIAINDIQTQFVFFDEEDYVYF